jgi:hypothetical protein
VDSTTIVKGTGITGVAVLDRNARNFHHPTDELNVNHALRVISINERTRLTRASDTHIIRNHELPQSEQVEPRWHGNVVRSGVRVGSVDGFA